MVKSGNFIGQSLACVTLFLTCMHSVTFWDTGLILSKKEKKPQVEKSRILWYTDS